MKTILTIDHTKFRINGALTYSEYPECPEKYQGLLMNARFIQGVFDDAADVRRFDRFGRTFDPEKNTDDLIAALPDWYAHGLRAFTVGFQGGGPCFTIPAPTINNNPFSADGTVLDEAYKARMKRIIEAADELGMIVIVSYFYGHQVHWIKDDAAIIEAVKTASNWLRDEGFTNTIIEVANEHDIDPYKCHPILFNDRGIVELMDIARRESGGMPVGCSSTGAYFSPELCDGSDVILIHGNNMTRQAFYTQIRKVRERQPDKPIVTNEDSQALTNMQVALNEGVSWGYYNNMTKQEPPTDWRITAGEDTYYAQRLCLSLGIPCEAIPQEEQFRIMGLDQNESYDNKRWIRMGSLYPEKIDHVEYFRNGTSVYKAYDDPFSINFYLNWIQGPFTGIEPGEHWKAEIHLTDGSIIVKEKTIED